MTSFAADLQDSQVLDTRHESEDHLAIGGSKFNREFELSQIRHEKNAIHECFVEPAARPLIHERGDHETDDLLDVRMKEDITLAEVCDHQFLESREFSDD